LSAAVILVSLSVRQDFGNKLDGSSSSFLERPCPLDLSSKSLHLFVRYQIVTVNLIDVKLSFFESAEILNVNSIILLQQTVTVTQLPELANTRIPQFGDET